MKQRVHGFTLVELLMVLAVMGVLAAVAFPGMRDYMDKQRLVSQVRAISEMAQFARSEAIKHSGIGVERSITMTVSPAAPWFVGLANGTAACTDDATCQINQGGSDATYRLTASQCAQCVVETPTAVSIVTFDLRGVTSGAGAEQLVTLRSPMGKKLSLGITRLGRISLCSPSGAGNVGGYQTC